MCYFFLVPKQKLGLGTQLPAKLELGGHIRSQVELGNEGKELILGLFCRSQVQFGKE
jgi:hypothetical protein